MKRFLSKVPLAILFFISVTAVYFVIYLVSFPFTASLVFGEGFAGGERVVQLAISVVSLLLVSLLFKQLFPKTLSAFNDWVQMLSICFFIATVYCAIINANESVKPYDFAFILSDIAFYSFVLCNGVLIIALSVISIIKNHPKTMVTPDNK